MAGNTDKIKGRIKQAVGAIAGNKKLQRDGRNDERAGRVQEKADDAIEVVHDKLGDVAETLSPGEKE